MIEKETLDQIKPGAKVRVYEKVKEGDKEREAFFEGVVIARKHNKEKGATFTVRGKVDDCGLEKIYPIYSPLVSKVKILGAVDKIKRAKLYYIRKLSAKRIREKIKQTI